MAFYVASYDLHNQRHYQPVWDQLNEWGAVRLLESLWLINSTLSASDIRTTLKSKADSDDSIAVIELKPASLWACDKAKLEGVAWLRKHILA